MPPPGLRTSLAAVLLAAGAPVAMAQVTISDTEFADANWAHSILWSLPTASLGAVSQQAGGGNPGAWQQGSHTTNGPFATIYDGHLYTAAAYNPATQGGINSLDIRYDLIDITTAGIQSGLLVAQAGHTYFVIVDSSDYAAWTTVGASNIAGTGNQWQEVSVSGVSSGHPDFSAAGAPMTFGYYTFNWSLSAGFLIQRTWGIDNFSVTIHGAGPAPCYPNCDGSTTPPILNVSDFSCFLNRFAAGDSYANCDNSTTPPVLNVSDFSCFLNRFAAGCS